MCGYDRYTWLRSQDIYGTSAILKGNDFFKKSALRVSIAETLSTVSKAKARSATLWGRVEKLRALSGLDINILVKDILTVILLRLLFLILENRVFK